MDGIWLTVTLLIGISGLGIICAFLHKTVSEKKHQAAVLSEQNTQLHNELNQARINESILKEKLHNEQNNAEEKLRLLNEAEAKLTTVFKALSADALQNNNKSFVELAKSTLEKFQESAHADLEKRQTAIQNLVKPLKESLEKYDQKVQDIEEKRTSAYSSLDTHLKSLADTQKLLQSETSNLVKALRTPTVRGNWGEIQLKKVVEIAGMIEYCDFVTQDNVQAGENRIRPDMIIKLPNGKNIIVDSKAPLEAYLDALESKDDADRLTHLKRHAQHIKDHLTKLGKKSYWEWIEPTPEFVVMFLPGESFFSAALEQEPGLIEFGIRDHHVILATPTTLIALLKAVSYGWRQEQLTKNALEIRNIGKELYKRFQTFASHFGKIQRGLSSAITHYNNAVGSLERSVLPGVRKFNELGASSNIKVPVPQQIESLPRKIASPDIPEQNADSTIHQQTTLHYQEPPDKES